MSSAAGSSSNFTLLYFGFARSFTKKDRDVLPGPMPITSLYTELEKLYPGIKERVLSSSALTINLNYIDLDEESSKPEPDVMIIQVGDEVAVIPPVSSG